MNVLLISQNDELAAEICTRLKDHYIAVLGSTVLPIDVFSDSFEEIKAYFDAVVVCGGNIYSAFEKFGCSCGDYLNSKLHKIAVGVVSTPAYTKGLRGTAAVSYMNSFVIIQDAADIEQALSNPLRQQKAQLRKRIVSGNLMDYKIQNLMFPDGGWKEQQSALFYRGAKLDYLKITPSWLLRDHGFTEYFTYFNSLSVRKWNRYTNAVNYTLHLKVKGRFYFSFFGHWTEAKDEAANGTVDGQLDEIRKLDISDIEKRVFFYKIIRRSVIQKEEFPQHIVDTHGKVQEVTFPAEYAKSSVLGFSITADPEVEIFGGYWSAEVDKTLLNNVNIALCTTTFKKEDYIIPNIKSLKAEIFNLTEQTAGMDELARHFYVSVVDNGRTLTDKEVNSPNIVLYPNRNTGGAGGFTRGMLETMRLIDSEAFAATHILFMDDDVQILPESIKRTYALLRLMQDGYKSELISGAMLKAEKMNIQLEDVGFVSESASMWRPQKPQLDMSVWDNVLLNEENYDQENQYAAWWYCVVPISYINKDNLSLPLFFRTDDIEFSLRNKIHAITMNGIGLWHMSGESKYSPVYDKYMSFRNMLFIKATSGIAQGCDFFGEIEKEFLNEIRRFNYCNAYFLICAVEDFMKGPEYFGSADWESVIKDLNAKKEVYKPLGDFPQIKVDMNALWRFVPLDPYDMELFINTDNGHKLPDMVLRDGVGVIPYDHFDNPGEQYLRRWIFAVNPVEGTGVLRKINRERYAELMAYFETVKSEYDSVITDLTEEYRSYAAVFKSQAFWKRYLDL